MVLSPQAVRNAAPVQPLVLRMLTPKKSLVYGEPLRPGGALMNDQLMQAYLEVERSMQRYNRGPESLSDFSSNPRRGRMPENSNA